MAGAKHAEVNQCVAARPRSAALTFGLQRGTQWQCIRSIICTLSCKCIRSTIASSVHIEEQEFPRSTSRASQWDRLAVGSRVSMTGTAPLNRRPAGIACVIGTPGLNSSDYIRVHAGQCERRGRSSVCLGQAGQPRTTGKRPWRPTHRHLRRLLHAGYPDAARSRLAYTRLIRALV